MSKRDCRTAWGAAVITLAVILLLSTSTWGAPLARVEDIAHLLQLPIFQPGEPSLLYDDEGHAFAAIVP